MSIDSRHFFPLSESIWAFFFFWNHYTTQNPICKEVFKNFFQKSKNFSKNISKRG